jgi:hypothetical protein
VAGWLAMGFVSVDAGCCPVAVAAAAAAGSSEGSRSIVSISTISSVGFVRAPLQPHAAVSTTPASTHAEARGCVADGRRPTVERETTDNDMRKPPQRRGTDARPEGRAGRHSPVQ